VAPRRVEERPSDAQELSLVQAPRLPGLEGPASGSIRATRLKAACSKVFDSGAHPRLLPGGGLAFELEPASRSQRRRRCGNINTGQCRLDHVCGRSRSD